jgi:hypothetical protein
MLEVSRPTTRSRDQQGTQDNPAGQRKRRLAVRLARDLALLSGLVLADTPPAPRRPNKAHRRLLYRSVTSLSDSDLVTLVAEIGPDRVLRAIDRYTAPRVAAE